MQVRQYSDFSRVRSALEVGSPKSLPFHGSRPPFHCISAFWKWCFCLHRRSLEVGMGLNLLCCFWKPDSGVTWTFCFAFSLRFFQDLTKGHFWTCCPCNFSLCRPIPKHSVPGKRCSCLPKWLKVLKDCHTRLASARNLCFLAPLSYHERYPTSIFAISAVSCLFQTDVMLTH